ncbi:hypothetical protein BOX15_Mlig005646g4 [Macrostomum lignano]|uniref:Uncharacterized protein n=1 Tax=Macrostomum lignano TaxID=282301 RepID=A0A267FI12_9PLAT|nr:hypothetical protein BOX15_Mlig005646g4 [Macrostomum lignano]
MLTNGNYSDEASGAIGCVGDDCYDALGSDSVSTPSEGSDSEVSEDDNRLEGYSVGGRGHTDYYSDFYRTAKTTASSRAGNRAAARANTRAYDDHVEVATTGRGGSSNDDDDGEPPILQDYCSVTRPELPQLRLLRNQPPFGYSGDPQMSPNFQRNLRDLIDGGVDGSGGSFSAPAALRGEEAKEEIKEEENGATMRTTMDPLLMQQLLQKQHEKQHRGGEQELKNLEQEQQWSQQQKQGKQKPLQKGRTVKRRVRKPEVVHAGDLAGNRGELDVDTLLSFINGCTAGPEAGQQLCGGEHGAKAQPQPAKKKSSSSAKDKSASSKTNSAAPVPELSAQTSSEKENNINNISNNSNNKNNNINNNREYKDDEAPASAVAAESKPPPAPPSDPEPVAIFTDFDSLSSCDREILANGMMDSTGPPEPDFEVVLSKKDRRQMRMKPEQQQQQRPPRKAPMHPNRNRHPHPRQALSHVVNGNALVNGSAGGSLAQSPRSASPAASVQQKQQILINNPDQYAALLHQKAQENALLRRDLDSCSSNYSCLVSFLYSLC